MKTLYSKIIALIKRIIYVNEVSYIAGKHWEYEEDDIYLVLFVPEMNLELEWRKADNEEIVLQKYEKNKNYLYIDFMVNSECKNKYLRAFDELSVELNFIDYTPIDVKCRIDLTK